MNADTRSAATELEVAAVQRQTMGVLVGSQILGGVGVAAGVTVGTLLASDVLGREDLAGLVPSAGVMGSALLALPAARLAVSHGRRAGLTFGYGIAVVGAALAVASAQWKSFPLLLLASALYGGGTTATSQSRFAAADLAEPLHRGRALSIVVWATTIGAVVGPNLVGFGGVVGEAVGVEKLAGPYIVGGVGMALATLMIWLLLRPDPLVLARRLAGTRDGAAATPVRRHGVLRQGLAAASHSPAALLGLGALAVAHTTMVSVMVMTPIHMDHGGASLQVIGLVISGHILGMFALSPVVGWAADRFGRVPVIVVGGVLLLAATALAGTSDPGASPRLSLGLFVLGLGWSCCLVAGSTLLTDAVSVEDRPTVQGASDLLMGLAAGLGGALAGVVVGVFGYGPLNAGAAALVGGLLVVTSIPACRAVSNNRSR